MTIMSTGRSSEPRPYYALCAECGWAASAAPYFGDREAAERWSHAHDGSHRDRLRRSVA